MKKDILILLLIATQTTCLATTVKELLGGAEGYAKNEEFQKAIMCYEKVISQYPDMLNVWFKLGHCYLQIGKFDNALFAFDQIIKKSNSICARYNRAFTLKNAKRIDQAISEMKDILLEDPEYNPAHLSLGFSLLQNGEFTQGWKQHERYLKSAGKFAPELRTLIKNNDLNNKTIILVPEGGLGDTVQFIRYAKRLNEMGAYIVARVQKELIPLLSNCSYIYEINATGTKIPPHDAYATLMSLPAVFYDTQDTILQDMPYIFPDAKRIAYWKEKLGSDTNLKIGICWQPSISNDASRMVIARRGIPLELFAPLFTIPNITWYSLQQRDGIEQIKEFSQKNVLTLFDDTFDVANGPFMDSAAVIDQLDLIISADTSTAHLAGALGKPVWLLLPFVSDWRWIVNRTDTPWYPTMTIFHQDEPFNWQGVLAHVYKKLERRIKKIPEKSGT